MFVKAHPENVSVSSLVGILKITTLVFVSFLNKLILVMYALKSINKIISKNKVILI